MSRIGIIGGSFDPIHIGHLILADQARSFYDLDQVIFIPARISPFKLNKTPTEGNLRYDMIKLAVADNLYFSVSDCELKKETVSYTVETLKELQQELGDEAELFFITGTDAFLSIEEWHGAEELLKQFSFLVGTRPGYQEEQLDQTICRIRALHGAFIEKVMMPEVDISSTNIKDRIKNGKSVKYLLPKSVTGYIMEKGLYGADNVKIRVTTLIQNKLKTSRLRHTYGVVQTASALARQYGADEEKAELAALFHDAYRETGNLEHGPVAADAMREQFGVTDQDICNAVRFHTTGRVGMSTLEKVIYLADAIEPNRSYPGVDQLRRAAELDLDIACLKAMEHTIQYLKESGEQLDYRTLEARNWLKRASDERSIHEQ